MKIDGSGVDGLHQAIDRVGGPTPAVENSAPTRSDKTQRTRDQAKFSTDAQWLQSAVQAAQDGPNIRQDVVERMRAAVAKGELGTDAERLADALLDTWIGAR